MLEEPVLDIDDIQGNIFPGFKKDSQHFLFFQIIEPESAKLWLKSLAPKLSKAREVLEAHSIWKARRLELGHEPKNLDFLFINCAISAQGFVKLGVPGIEEFDDIAFKLGLEKRSGTLGDPPAGSGSVGSPETWVFGAGSRSPDVLLILASDNLDWAVRAEEEFIASAQKQGLELIHVDRGRVRPGALAGHEHFGFKDGISHPAIRGRKSNAPADFIEPRTWPEDSAFDIYRDRFAAPGRPLVWPGHFLFGYVRQQFDEPELSRPNSEPPGPAWAVNGSFLVYRRLSQDVQKFLSFLAEASETLRHNNGFDENLTPERLGALLVGRWASGWPVMRDPNIDRGEQHLANATEPELAENYFKFSEATTIALPNDPYPLNQADPNGLICPFAAHIRKVNPRDDATDMGSKERTFQKLLLRRGITFGPEITEQASAERGLLFVAFQTSIVNQFEFLMNEWVNEANKPHSNGGVDPIIGAARDTKISLGNGTKKFELPIPGGWVTPTGGEYMFAPGVRFFSDIL
ncbi:Dyp-type peroxidase [Ancylothrix sp. C2]|uniref:Dyp-type peroxidase n=1 Tax=Ancylothrix sp. D3o TaxID=2953691 RepID=UPI0021BB06D1|nr:Dyp-type peroxidase [Ancylothrix sp. D3o]MCT7952249.1 Dyp-type peroxidase [Ancylothrix sp. D3o]